MTTASMVLVPRITDADVQARFRQWVHDVFEPRRHALKLHDAALGHAWQPRTARAKWYGDARYDVADLATIAQHQGFGRPFVNFVLDLPPLGVPVTEEMRAALAACRAQLDELLGDT